MPPSPPNAPPPPAKDGGGSGSGGASASGGGPAGPERFDEILGRLRGLVERLESGNLPLEDSLRSFEEGMELCRRGAAILDGAERKVETLIAASQGGGAPRTAPFQMPEE
jgi:exodeoxyribonuclease VII small subunit